jgi:hypothetical protein
MEFKNVGSRVSVNIISSTEKMVQRKEDRQCTKQWYSWPHFILLGNLVQYHWRLKVYVLKSTLGKCVSYTLRIDACCSNIEVKLANRNPNTLCS